MTRNQPTCVDAAKLEEHLVELLEDRPEWRATTDLLARLRSYAALDHHEPIGRMHRARIPRAAIETDALRAMFNAGHYLEADALGYLYARLCKGDFTLRTTPDLVDTPELVAYDRGVTEWPFDTGWTKTGLALGALAIVPAVVALKGLDIVRSIRSRKG